MYLFATDRRVDSRRPLVFDTEPADGNQLSYGTCYVSIPRDHRMGELEGPSIWRLEFRPDPDLHVVLISKELSASQRFFDDIRLLAQRSDEQDALVFVHGYNVTFDDAARRTAQLAYDLGFKGPAVLFSWPSQGALAGYNKDARNVELSVDSLRSLLTDLSRTANVKRIHVIAHSMGNRALVGALTRLGPSVPVIAVSGSRRCCATMNRTSARADPRRPSVPGSSVATLSPTATCAPSPFLPDVVQERAEEDPVPVLDQAGRHDLLRVLRIGRRRAPETTRSNARSRCISTV